MLQLNVHIIVKATTYFLQCRRRRIAAARALQKMGGCFDLCVCGYLSCISSSKDMCIYLIAYMNTSYSSITKAQYSNGVVAGVGIQGMCITAKMGGCFDQCVWLPQLHFVFKRHVSDCIREYEHSTVMGLWLE